MSCAARKLASGEGRVEGEAGGGGGARLIQPAEVGERRAEMEMRHGEFAVAMNASLQPGDGLLVAAERIPGEAEIENQG